MIARWLCKYSWSLTVIISHPLYYSRCMAIVPVAIVPVAIVPVAIVPVAIVPVAIVPVAI